MESFEVQFASSEIEDITIAAAEKKIPQNLLEFIHAAAGIKVLSNIRGRLFERYAHRISLFPVKNSSARSSEIRKNLNSNWEMCNCVNTESSRMMMENP